MFSYDIICYVLFCMVWCFWMHFLIFACLSGLCFCALSSRRVLLGVFSPCGIATRILLLHPPVAPSDFPQKKKQKKKQHYIGNVNVISHWTWRVNSWNEVSRGNELWTQCTHATCDWLTSWSMSCRMIVRALCGTSPRRHLCSLSDLRSDPRMGLLFRGGAETLGTQFETLLLFLSLKKPQ